MIREGSLKNMQVTADQLQNRREVGHDRVIRERLLSLPARIAGDMAAETDAMRIQSMLETALRLVLDETIEDGASPINEDTTS